MNVLKYLICLKKKKKIIVIDDTRKSSTPNSSMMGCPDQWHQPEKSLNGEISSKAKQVGQDLRSSRPEQNLILSKLYSLLIGHHTSLCNRKNWWEPLPTTVRSIRPNDTVSKTVITVTSETVDLHEGRWLFRRCAMKALIYEKGRHSDTSFTFKTTKILTFPSEDSWPASTGLLWLYCSSFRIH